MSTITLGVDSAKNVFSVCAMDGAGHVVQRQDLKRDALAQWLAQLPVGSVVAMEACAGAHHWGRRCREYGRQPRIIAAQFVAPFRKSRTIKNDRNDAEAIATAARQGNLRFVPVKTLDQQARLACHRVRESYKAESLRWATSCAACWPSSVWWWRKATWRCGEHWPTSMRMPGPDSPPVASADTRQVDAVTG